MEKVISMNYGSSTSNWKPWRWVSEAWHDTFDEGYLHQFQTEPTHKIPQQQQKHWV